MRVAIYARVSTTDQNCSMQLSALREYCARQGWEIADEYVDSGVSGAKASRPGLDRMVADAENGRFTLVLAWKLDRLGRSLVNCLQLIDKLKAMRVDVIVTTQPIDTRDDNPASRLVMQILASCAEFERAIFIERIKEGLAQAKRDGKTLGKPSLISQETRDKVLALKASGLSNRAIAKQVGGMSYETVRQVARREGQ